MLKVCPNPFVGTTTILLATKLAAATRIEVCDAGGRLVRHLTVPGDAEHAVWDGRDDAGHALVKGVYLAKVVQAGVTSSARLLKLQ